MLLIFQSYKVYHILDTISDNFKQAVSNENILKKSVADNNFSTFPTKVQQLAKIKRNKK